MGLVDPVQTYWNKNMLTWLLLYVCVLENEEIDAGEFDDWLVGLTVAINLIEKSDLNCSGQRGYEHQTSRVFNSIGKIQAFKLSKCRILLLLDQFTGKRWH